MASEIRVNKINSQTGVGTITLSPTGVDISGITTAATLKVGTGVTASSDGDIFATGVCTATSFSGDGSALTGIDLGAVTGATGDFSIADKIVHTGDTDTAIRFPSADTITAETGGSESLRIDSNGRLIIGATSVSPANSYSDNLVVSEASGNVGMQFVGNNSNSNYASIYLGDAGGLQRAFFESQLGANGNFTMGTSGSGPIRFNNSGGERLRIGSEGNLALGGTNTSSYSNQAHLFIGGVGDIYADTGVSSGKSLSLSNNAYINTSGNWVYRVTDKATNIYQYDGITGFRYAASGTAGNTITWTEAARFDNDGRLLIGTTTYPDGSADGVALRASNGERAFSRGSTNTRYQLVFYNPNGNIGRIETSGSSTSYLTSSDYRLKENATAISDGITRLKTLKPYRFNFKTDATKTLDGFFAHEVTAVPEAISGTKDEVDSDNKPVYQAIDQAKLVPLLTAALQEAVAKIEVLETRLNNAGIAT